MCPSACSALCCTRIAVFLFDVCATDSRKDISRRRIRALASGEVAKGGKTVGKPAAVPVVTEHGAFDRDFAVDPIKTKAKVCSCCFCGGGAPEQILTVCRHLAWENSRLPTVAL